MRILVTGAAGSGTTTLGRAIADRVRFLFFDADDYYWEPSNPSFRRKRDPELRLSMSTARLSDALLPGWIGRLVKVQWDHLRVRILDPATHQLLHEHIRQRGRHRINPDDNPKKMPLSTTQLLARAARAGSHIVH